MLRRKLEYIQQKEKWLLLTSLEKNDHPFMEPSLLSGRRKGRVKIHVLNPVKYEDNKREKKKWEEK